MAEDCEREHLDDTPEGLLLLRLYEYADAIAPEIGMAPSEWLHKKVEDFAKVKRENRGGLRLV